MNPLMLPTCKLVVLKFLIFILILITIFQICIQPRIMVQEEVKRQLFESQMTVELLESMYQSRIMDVNALSQYLKYALNHTDPTNTIYNHRLWGALSQQTHSIVRHTLTTPKFITSIDLPNAFNFFPHLVEQLNSLKPAFLLSKGKGELVSIVLGIPHVNGKYSNLELMLDDLIDNMNEIEQKETLIIIYVGKTDMYKVQLVANQIENRFSPYIESGLIEIISPSSSYYPHFISQQQISRKMDNDHVKSPAKQNLDYAFLMSYARPKGTFYVQLQDDMKVERGFITTMKNCATHSKIRSWHVYQFSEMGFIGNMFKSSELSWIIQFFEMFYNDQSADCLLHFLIEIRVCRQKRSTDYCRDKINKVWLRHKPSLFYQQLDIEDPQTVFDTRQPDIILFEDD